MESPASVDFYAAVSTVAVTQIFRSVGYTSASPATLRAVSDIAVRYILSIGRISAASAASHSRTECNLLDLVLSLEMLNSDRGFSGGSDPTLPLLDSVVLKELMAFVRIKDEIPFAKRIIKERNRNTISSSSSSSSRSYAQMGKLAPMAHVPRWLPCFPEAWEVRNNDKKEEIYSAAEVVNGSVERGCIKSEKRLSCGFDRGLNLLEKREKIRFTIEFNSVGKKRRMNFCNLGVD